METDILLDSSVKSLFEKKYCFLKEKDWKLPSNVLQNDEYWIVKSFNDMKEDLNSTKSLLNDKGENWHKHTAWINKASLVIETIRKIVQPEILTQAWCKFYEILSSFDLIPASKSNLKTLHLCEAPGAFISALNYYLCTRYPSTNWEWMANTLNPYYEGHNIRNVVVDDRLLFPTLKNWYFGQDNTGDITDANYIDDICSLADEVKLFDLVTADGSIDCLNAPGEQELVVAKLHFAETLVALNSLLPLGSFVIKKFTFFECVTVCELYLLNCVFEQVHVFKPVTSRASNSEVYVVCTRFHGSEVLKHQLQKFKDIYRTKGTLPIFPQSVIPKSFMQQLEECMKMFADLQIHAIKENLSLYMHKANLDVKKLNELKEICADLYVKKYSVQSSLTYDSCKLFSTKKKILTSFCDKTNRNHKTLYFQAVGDTFNNIMRSASMEWYDKLIDLENRIDLCFPLNKKRPLEVIEWHFPSKEIRQRMKSKSFQNWITLGKKIVCIQNSKFCYPVLLHLWNRVSHEPVIDIQCHVASQCYWDLDTLINILNEDDLSNNYLLPVSSSENCYENDPLLLHLKEVFDVDVNCHPGVDISMKGLSSKNKIIYINCTTWVSSLHQELIIKKSLTEVLHFTLKFLKKGDALLLCVQSVLTRYVSGLIFMLLSLFEKFAPILPEDCALACIGQIWILKYFQEPKWMSSVIQHLATIKELNLSDDKEVLEIVPMTSLCGGVFYAHLRDLNNKHLLQRIRNFISMEKCKIEKSNCK